MVKIIWSNWKSCFKTIILKILQSLQHVKFKAGTKDKKVKLLFANSEPVCIVMKKTIPDVGRRRCVSAVDDAHGPPHIQELKLTQTLSNI